MAADLQFAIRAVNEASAALNAVKGDLDSLGSAADNSGGHLDKAGSAMRSAGQSADQAHGPLRNLIGAFGDVAKIASGFVLGSGITQAPGFFMDAAKAASEDEQSTARLNTTLRTLTDETGKMGPKFADASAAVAGLIQTGQDLAFSDDDVRDSVVKLVTATGDLGEAQNRSRLAMDLARGANIPLADASKLLGKVTDENLQVFKKMGITLTGVSTETEVLAAVQQKFGGQADAYAKSTAGQFEILKIRLSEAKEAIGYALMPVMMGLLKVATDMAPYVEKVAAKFGELAGLAFDKLKDLAEQYGPKLKDLAGIAWDKLTAVAGLVWDGLTGLASAGWSGLQSAWEVVGPILAAAAGLAWDGLEALGAAAWGALKEAWSVAGPILGTVAGLAWDGITALAGLVWDSLKDAWNAAGPYMKDIAKLTWDGLKELAGVSWSAMKDAWEKMGPKITDAAEASARFVQTLSGMEKAAGGLALIGPGFAGIVLAAKGLDMVGINFDSIKGAIQGIGDALGPLGSLWKGFIEDDLKEGGKQAKEVALAFGPLIDAFRDLGSQLQPLQPLLGPAVTVLAVLTALPFVPLAAGITLVLGGLKFLIQYIGQTAQGSIDTFTASVDLLNKAIDLFKQYLGPALASALQTIVNLSTDIINAFKPAGTWLINAGAAIVQGIIDGVKNAAPALMSKMKSLAKDALDSAKDFLGIKSPSTEFADQVGVPIAQGVSEGFGAEWPNTIGNIQNTMGISLDQLNRDLAAWESDFLATAARNARIELGGAFNVGQMFGSSATEGNYGQTAYGGGALGAYPGMANGGYWGTGSGYSGPTNLPRYLTSSISAPRGAWGDFTNNGGSGEAKPVIININAPVNGVDDLLKVLDTAARRMGYSGVLTP